MNETEAAMPVDQVTSYKYKELNYNQKCGLVAQRLNELEAQHFQMMILKYEGEPADQIGPKVQELQDRISKLKGLLLD